MVASDKMAENEEAPLDEKVIKRTQETLGRLIKAPPLTEKLLSRPPFRFLHDVITAVIKATGFMKGLHTESDLKSDNVKEKEQKVAFLQKTVDYVVFVLGHPISTNPVKVVAGKEADKTNEFLQAIAEAATKKVDNDAMVKRFNNGERIESSVVSSAPQVKQAHKPATQESKSKTQNVQPPQQTSSKPKERPKENADGKSIKVNNKDDKHRNREESPERPADTTNLKNRPREAGRERGNKSKERGDADDSEGELAQGEQGSSADHQSNRRLVRPPSARGRQPSGVPGSRKPNDISENQPSENLAKPSKLATPSASDAKPRTVIQKAAKGADSDEEDEFVVREAGPGALTGGPADNTATALLGSEDQHGALVQKIIDTTKALDAKSGSKTSKLSPAEEAALRRQREAVTKEMEKLCAAVQASARLAAPLARLSELVQEDLDAMNAELSMWRAEHRKAVTLIATSSNPKSQQAAFSQKYQSTISAASVTNDALKGQLRELDQQISEMADAVAAVRGNCMRNEQRIAHMLSGSSGTATR